MPGARPQDLWDFLPPFNNFEKIVLFVGGYALKDFHSKSGTFQESKGPLKVATEYFELARSLIAGTPSVFNV